MTARRWQAAVPSWLVVLIVAIPISALILSVVIAHAAVKLRQSNRMRRRWVLNALAMDEDSDRDSGKRTIVGFFHPYCNAGGGGERVLWTAVACLQREERDVVIVVYTGDAVLLRKDDIVATVAERFGISLDPSTLLFIPLRKRHLVEAATWPRFTLLGQSLGSLLLGWEALTHGLVPDLWIDTMGYAFTYPLVKFLTSAPVASYTHYPTISSDMIRRVQHRKAGHTNASVVSSSWVLTELKLLYYRAFTAMYSLALGSCDVLLVNSSWTKGHIQELLGHPHPREPPDSLVVTNPPRSPMAAAASRFLSSPGLRQRQNSTFSSGTVHSDSSRPLSAVPTTAPHSSFFLPKGSAQALASGRRLRRRATPLPQLLYPPCDTDLLSQLDIVQPRERIVLSVAQFRPEKEHATQLEALKLLHSRGTHNDVRLVMCGSVRDRADEARVQSLKALAKQLGIENKVDFVVNASYPELVRWFARASVGLHTMIDEHFGITVVEFMAAGLIPLAHASAGPLLDIVVPHPSPSSPPTGFHATTPNSFADRLTDIFALSDSEQHAFRTRARRCAVERFGRDEFERGWMRAWFELCLVTRPT